MLQLVADGEMYERTVGKQASPDVGADDVVARGKERLQQEIQQANVSNSVEVSWGRLAALVALVLAMIAFASVIGS
jgi:hypothetical protein